jgi:hypothetical protein
LQENQLNNKSEQNCFRRTGLILLGFFILIDVTLGFYHLTHGGGWVSGSTELLFAVIMSAAGYLIFKNSPQKDQHNSARNRRIGLLIIAGVAIVVFILSIYHFTHNGLPSGILEALMTLLLVSILLLIKFSDKTR